MGTWDTGIYDNDSARDYIEGIIKNLVNIVEDMVRWDYTLLHPGMAQSNIFMCHIDMLNAICSRENLYQALPDAEEIKKWKAKYLEVWEFCIHECHPTEEYKIKRIKIIKKSFNDLIALSKRKG